jgi:subtilisin family serine protease
MAMLQVTVATLKKRTAPVDDPSNTTNVVGQVQKGFQFQSISQITNGLGTWYQDQDSYYYWGGGLTIVPTSSSAATPNPPQVDIPINTPPPPNNIYPQWMTDLNLPQIWTYATGQDVGVAVVDTGIISGNADLPYSQQNFFTYATGVSLQDNNGHGTNCAGLIGAKNRTGAYIGVAPGCNLYICKIAEHGYFDQDSDVSRYADAINWCAKQEKVHIISISWGNPIQNQQTLTNIQNAITGAIGNGKIVLCSIGDASGFGDPSKRYPACLQNTIAVGAIPVESANVFPYVNASLFISTQGAGITSYGIDEDTAHFQGTSQSNAIIAGVVALIIQKMKLSFSYAQIRGTLSEVSKATPYTIGGRSNTLAILDGNLLLDYFKS